MREGWRERVEVRLNVGWGLWRGGGRMGLRADYREGRRVGWRAGKRSVGMN